MSDVKNENNDMNNVSNNQKNKLNNLNNSNQERKYIIYNSQLHDQLYNLIPFQPLKRF